jgi:TPR repeat protein
MWGYRCFSLLLTGLFLAPGPSAAADNKKYTQTVALLLEEASRGDMTAQYNLGVLYANGRDVTQSYREAAKWYRLAAEKGDARAQSRLGFMYEIGQGVPKDFKEALKWYRLAADQGHVNSQLHLGNIHFNGLGVQKNQTEAYFWWSLAASKGSRAARRNLEMARENLYASHIGETERLAKGNSAITDQ